MYLLILFLIRLSTCMKIKTKAQLILNYSVLPSLRHFLYMLIKYGITNGTGT